VNLVV